MNALYYFGCLLKNDQIIMVNGVNCSEYTECKDVERLIENVNDDTVKMVVIRSFVKARFGEISRSVGYFERQIEDLCVLAACRLKREFFDGVRLKGLRGKAEDDLRILLKHKLVRCWKVNRLNNSEDAGILSF